ncbi:MAG TPA: YfhO family protein, partial [Chloroflexota bacterium]|nr:YfhO family protein [Chloroflexota bacterium]
ERFVILEDQFDLSRLPPPPAAETPIAPITFNRSTGNDISSAPGMVRIERAEPELLRLRVDARQAAMLFASDLIYPGWRAYVGGQETPIHRANYIFRSIYVPAGQHTVEFVYRPRSFRLGLLITLAATTATVLALALLAREGAVAPRWPRPLNWSSTRRGAKMAAPGSLPVSAPSETEPGGSFQKGSTRNGRQVSEGDAEEEHSEAGRESQEGTEVATASR